MFNLEYIKSCVKSIDDCSGDYERVHNLEDDLYHEAIIYVANGNVLAEEMAKELLKTKKIKFPRYTA